MPSESCASEGSEQLSGISAPVALSTRARSRSLALTVAVGTLIAAALLSVNWYPVIVPDSLLYLAHSNDLVGTGLVQVGFRQLGYPVWIALTSGIGSALGSQPLHAIVVAQFALLAVSVGACIAALRWWSAPVVVVLTLPTTIAYANFILTESVAIPLAIVSASALVGVHRASPESRSSRAWTSAAAVSAILLPMIRLHYGLITLAVVIGLVLRAGDQRGKARFVAPALVVATVALLVVGLTVENRIENGVASPSLGAERALFWVLWETHVVDHRDVVANELPAVYLDGTPDALILKIDNSGLPYPDQRAAYRAANTAILSITDENLMADRIASASAVLLGGRLDDLGRVLLAVADKSPPSGAADIHQYGAVATVDEEWIATEYNGGMKPSPIFTAAGAVPTVPRPYLRLAIGIVVPAISVLTVYLCICRRSRGLAVPGVTTTLGYSAASFLFVFDNLRYLLPGLLFALVVVMGAALMRWQPPKAATPQSLPPVTPARTLS